MRSGIGLRGARCEVRDIDENAANGESEPVRVGVSVRCA